MANQNNSRKQSFHEWLKENKKLKLKHSAAAIIAAFEVASDYGLTHHIFHKSFWDMDSPADFAQACRKLLAYKVFVALQKYSAELLNRYDSLYYDFLKSLMESNDIQKSIGAQKKEENTKAEDSVRFDNIRDLSHTKPVRAVYFEEEISCPSSWKALYVDVLRALSIDYPHVFNKNLSFGHRKGPEFGDKNAAEQMIAPAEVNNSLYAETNYSSTDIVKRIRQLLDLCYIDYENLIICYKQEPSSTILTESQSEAGHNASEWIIEAIKSRKIQYCDNRNAGGCLWIVGGHELDPFIAECADYGYSFHYKSDGCKVFPYKKVWWTKDSTKTASKKNHLQSSTINIPTISADWIKYDFSNAPSFERTSPVYCNINGTEIIGKNWARILVAIVEHELSENNIAINSLYKTSLFSNRENRPFLMKDKIDGLNCSVLSNGYWINLNYGIPGLIKLIGEFCLYCGYDRNQIILYGVKKEGTDEPRYLNERTILDAVFMVLCDAQTPLTLNQIHQAILERHLYQFNTSNSIGMVQTAVYRHCLKAYELIHRGEPAIISTTVNGQKKYILHTSARTEDVSADKHDHADPIQSASSNEPKSRQIEEAESIVLGVDLDGIRIEDLAQKIKESVVGTKRIVQESMNIVAICDKLIHKQAFMDWDEGAQQLESILDKLMQKNDGYVSDVQLYDYARGTMELFLNDNDMDDVRKVYDFAEHLFSKECYHGKRYLFNGKTHISRENESVESKLDIIKKYSRDVGGVFEEKALEDYLRGLGVKTGSLRQLMRIFSEPIFLMYTPGVFISVESMKIDDSWLNKTSRALEILFDDVGDHIVLRDISSGWFALLPELPGSRPWTPLLLQNALFHYGEILKAKTISALAGQAADTLHAMLIRNDSEIRTFSDAVIAVFIDSSIEKRSFEAEELRQILLSKGLISGNELIWNMPKALPNDEHFAWDNAGEHVAIQI